VAESRIDELRRRLERDPGSRLFAQLAEEHRKAGDHAEAIRVARAGLALHPVYPSARLTLGRALLDAGEPGAARDELAQTLREAPDNILASRFLGQALEALGDAGGALRQYAATLKMTPGDRQLEAQIAALQVRHAAAARPPIPGGPAPRPALPTAGQVPVTQPMARAVAAAPPPLPAPTPPPLPVPPPPPATPVSPSAAVSPPAIAAQRTTPLAPPAPPASSERPLVPAPFEDRAEAAPTRPRGAAASEEAVATAAVETVAPASGAAGPAEPSVGAEAPALSTSTLAELYWKQGLSDRALEVYRQVLVLDPGNDRARARLAELEGEVAAAAAPDERALRRAALERTIRGLEGLLSVLGRR
jgi:tetratricopeptide (TPR) repeat protein